MTPDRLLKVFKTKAAIAEAAMVSHQAVSRWFKTGVVPPRSQKVLALSAKWRKSS